MDLTSRIAQTGQTSYRAPVNQANSGLQFSQRLESIQSSKEVLANKYGQGSVDPASVPVSHEQYLFGTNQLTSRNLDSLKNAKKAFSEKYGSSSINKEDIPTGIKNNFLNGLSPLRAGALGDASVYVKNGKAGTSLNIIG